MAQKHLRPSLFIFYLYVSLRHLHPHFLNNLSVGYSITELESGYDMSIIPTCFINHQFCGDSLVSQAVAERGPRPCVPHGFVEVAALRRGQASTGQRYMWLEWLCDAAVASLM